MPKEYPRSDRLASQIQRALASLVQSGLKDPRLTMPSILEVQVSKDLSHARALNRASGFLQREIGKSLKTRITPKLSFVYDDTDIRGRELSDLIDSAVANDKVKANQ
jgi:ribosome-binding factor A